MKVYNVLFKQADTPHQSQLGAIIPFVKPFSTLQKARDFVEDRVIRLGLNITSTLDDMNDEPTWTDYLCNDGQGNYYYFVIYFQSLD